MYFTQNVLYSNVLYSGDVRGVYSFCMCPGGQIVPTSTSPEELCINGMSFSRRHSPWANSALVVGVLPGDWQHLEAQHGPLAGVELQVGWRCCVVVVLVFVAFHCAL